MATWTEYFTDPGGNYKTFRGLSEDDAISLSVQLQQQGWTVIQRVMENPGDKESLAATPAAAEYVTTVADTVERARTSIPGALQSTTAQAADPNSPTVTGVGQTATGTVIQSSVPSSSMTDALRQTAIAVGATADPKIKTGLDATIPTATGTNPKPNLFLWGAIALGLFFLFGD
jgi:hypothetical protein